MGPGGMFSTDHHCLITACGEFRNLHGFATSAFRQRSIPIISPVESCTGGQAKGPSNNALSRYPNSKMMCGQHMVYSGSSFWLDIRVTYLNVMPGLGNPSMEVIKPLTRSIRSAFDIVPVLLRFTLVVTFNVKFTLYQNTKRIHDIRL